MRLLLIDHKRPPSIDRRPVEEAGDALLNNLADLVSDCWTDEPVDRPSACSVQSTLARLLFAIGGDPRFHCSVCEAVNVPVSEDLTAATSNKSSSTERTHASPESALQDNGVESTIQDMDDESIGQQQQNGIHQQQPGRRSKDFSIIPRSWMHQMSMYLTATSKESSTTNAETKGTDVSAESAQVNVSESTVQELRDVFNRGFELYKKGDFDEAKSVLEDCLEKQRRVLGSDHLSTLITMNNLANNYNSQGNYGEARRLFEECLERRRRVLGDDHPDTLRTMSNLANNYNSQGNYGEAKRLYEVCIERRSRVLGDDHPSTLNTMRSLAYNYKCQGNYGEATRVYQECLMRRRRVLGDDQADFFNSMSIMI